MSSTDSAPLDWITDAWRVGLDTYANWRKARTIRLGAGIAYYSLFGVIPLLTLSIVLAQLLVSKADVEQLFLDVGDTVGLTDEQVRAILDEVDKASVQTGLGIVGFVSLVLAAMFVFWAVQDAFDEVWELPVQEGIVATFRRRLMALVIVGGGAIMIILVLIVNSVSGLLQSLIPGSGRLGHGIEILIGALSSWVVLVLAIGVAFQVLTRVHIGLLPLTFGALATAGLLTIGTTLLGFYLSNYASQSLTGAAAGILLALLWLYYVAQMVLVGAHLTRVLEERRRLTDPSVDLTC